MWRPERENEEKRRAIQSILPDDTLSNLERRTGVQRLMDGGGRLAGDGPREPPDLSAAAAQRISDRGVPLRMRGSDLAWPIRNGRGGGTAPRGETIASSLPSRPFH